MATAVARLRLRTCSLASGMPKVASACALRTAAGRPRLSLPKTRRSSARKRTVVYERRARAEERLPARVLGEPHVRPVIEAGAAEMAVVDREAERIDQVERRGGGEADAADRAGVLRDLGRDQDDVHAGGTLRRALAERHAPAADREHDPSALVRLGMAQEVVVRGTEEARLVPALHAAVEDVLCADAERRRVERLAGLVVQHHGETPRRIALDREHDP